MSREDNMSLMIRIHWLLASQCARAAARRAPLAQRGPGSTAHTTAQASFQYQQYHLYNIKVEQNIKLKIKELSNSN